MISRLLLCLSSLTLCSACAPTIATTQVSEDRTTGTTDIDVGEGEAELGDANGEDGTTEPPADPGNDEAVEEDGEDIDPGFAFAGEYRGEMVIMIAWPDWGGGEYWDELCVDGGAWTVEENGDLSGILECEIFIDGDDPTRLEVELSGAVDEDGDVGGALFYEVRSWIDGSAEFSGSMLDEEMVFHGETEVDLGWAEASISFEFSGDRR